jgi:hypothetical protein
MPDSSHNFVIENKREVLPQVCHEAFDFVVSFGGGELLIYWHLYRRPDAFWRKTCLSRCLERYMDACKL